MNLVPRTPDERIAKVFVDLVKTQKELADMKENWPVPEPGKNDRFLLEMAEAGAQGQARLFDEIVRTNYPGGDLVN